jgi:mannose-1-phosphate guanylyltransferase
MTRPRLRAVVLAAGLATRLRPLTAAIPKALLPVLGRPLIAWTLERLERAGVEATAINLHHCADAIPAALGDRFGDMPLVYSREPTILGTLGALHPLREFLAPADLVLLVNGDSLSRWPFDELIARHRAAQRDAPALATLLLSATADVGSFGGGVAVDTAGRIATLLPGPSPHPRRVFLGAHVFAPSLAQAAPASFSDIVRELYEPRLIAGARIEALTTDAPWHDVGTPGRYLDAVLDWAAREGRGEESGSPRESAAAVVEDGARIDPGAAIRRSIVLAGARIGGASRIDRAVIGPGVELAAGSVVENALVTPRAWGLVASSREEGSLVYTPLEPAAAVRA